MRRGPGIASIICPPPLDHPRPLLGRHLAARLPYGPRQLIYPPRLLGPELPRPGQEVLPVLCPAEDLRPLNPQPDDVVKGPRRTEPHLPLHGPSLASQVVRGEVVFEPMFPLTPLLHYAGS